jgi:F-type H+-transporting ATPase subunit delta
MSTTRIARRYAKPLLDLAIEKKLIEDVKKDLQGFTSICKGSPEFVRMLKSPILSNFKKAEILRAIFKGKVTDLTMSVFEIMSRKNREFVLPDVASEYLNLYNDKMGIQKATVTTTFEMDDKLRKSFEKVVADLSGKKPALEEKVDESILGGFMLKMNDKQIDESLSGQLSELRLQFKKEKK